MVLQLIIPILALLVSLVLMPGALVSPSWIGWIAAAVGIICGILFWRLPFPTPPFTTEAKPKNSRLWAVLPWWRTLLAALLLAIGLTAVHNMLAPVALYDVAHVWAPEQGKYGDVIVVAADSETRQAQGGEDEAVMRAQIGQTLCNMAECKPSGVLVLRIFPGRTEGDAILIRGFESLGEKGIPVAYLRSLDEDDPPELVAAWQAYPKSLHEAKLSVLALTRVSCGVDATQSNNPIAILLPQAQYHDMWVSFGKPMHPLYSMGEFNQGVILSNRRDPISDDVTPEDACEGKIVILTELLGGGLVKSYSTPITEAMPAHQFWALALDDASRGKVVEPLPGIILGLWVILWTALGVLLAAGTRRTGMGFLVAVAAIIASVCLLMFVHLWAGILPAAVGAALSGHVTKRGWSLE